jgi:hypothetical protein
LHEGNAPNGFQGDAIIPAYDETLITVSDIVDTAPTVSCDAQPDSFYDYTAPNPTPITLHQTLLLQQ